MKKFLFIFAAILVSSAIFAALIVGKLRGQAERKQEKAADHKAAERNPAVMDPALVESLLSPTPTAEVKGTFDQKSQAGSPSPSPL